MRSHSLDTPSAPAAARGAAAVAAVALLVTGAPELLGGVYPWGLLSIAAMSLVALGLTLWSQPAGRTFTTPLVAAMLVALFWTAFQALPLSCSVVDHVAPDSVDDVRRVNRLLELPPPRWCTISRDPTATREELIKGLSILAAFLSAAMLAGRGHRLALFRAIAASGVLLAAVAIAHASVSAERVFGIYSPVELRKPLFVAPLLNLNTLGGYLAMCAPLLVGLTLREKLARWRVPLLLGTALVASGVFMTRSRGAVGALFLGLGLLVVMWRLRVAPKRRARSSAHPLIEMIGMPLAIAAALSLCAYAWSAELIGEFRGGDFEKFRVIGFALAFAVRHPWLGVGRGAFGSAFAGAHSGPNRFVYAENFVAQWASEWGLPVTLLLLAALAHAFLRALLGTRSTQSGRRACGARRDHDSESARHWPRARGRLRGRGCTAGAATSRTMAVSPRQPSSGRRTGSLLAVLAAVVLLVALAGPIRRDHAAYLWQGLENRLTAKDRPGFRVIAARAMLAHPADPIFAVLIAAESLQHGDTKAGHWINRALQLVPTWAAPHLQAAQWLWNAGRHDQALLELGLAIQIDPDASRPLIGPIASRDPLGVARVIPRGPNRNRLLELVVECLEPGSGASHQIDLLILSEFPQDGRALLRAAQRDLGAGSPEAAAEKARRVRERAPELAGSATLLEAQALLASGRRDQAALLLAHAAEKISDYRPLLRALIEIHAENGEREAALAVLAELRGRSVGDAAETAETFLTEGRLERAFGNLGGAIRAYDRAYSITGDSSALIGVAETAERVGDRGRAAWAYGMICDRTNGDRSACARRDALLARRAPESPDKAAQPNPR